MTGEPSIDYEALTQNAMRSVVQAVLARTATSGLPGEHHFYVSFDTQADAVAISKRLKEKYPQEMTVVLQHRFWDLNVYDDHFEVKLTFDGIPERLVIPYKAIKVFFDPSVRYGLQFEEPEFTSEAIDRTMSPLEMSDLMKPHSDGQGSQEDDDEEFSPLPYPRIHSASSRVGRTGGPHPISEVPSKDNSEDAPMEAKEPATGSNASQDTHKAAKNDDVAAPAAASASPADVEDDASNDTEADNTAGAEIVSLDAFRKK